MRTITRHRGRTSLALSLIAALALAIPVQRARADSNSNARIIPIGATPLGKTYGQWGAAWWQYAFSNSVPQNPLLDQTGAQCGTGQANNPVFFLVGVINVTGTATRSCTVPAGKMLFFPILNFEDDNVCPPRTPQLTVAQLQAEEKGFMDGATELEADIDGVQVSQLPTYRAASPGSFSVTFPDNNLCGIPAGTYSPVVSDGYWLMLAPLTAGSHTIHFHGRLPDFNFTLDITYNLTVAS